MDSWKFSQRKSVYNFIMEGEYTYAYTCEYKNTSQIEDFLMSTLACEWIRSSEEEITEEERSSAKFSTFPGIVDTLSCFSFFPTYFFLFYFLFSFAFTIIIFLSDNIEDKLLAENVRSREAFSFSSLDTLS